MQIGTKYFDIKFEAETAKEAYLKACKWVAKHIISDEGLKDSVYKFIKVRESPGYAEIRLEVFCALDDKDVQGRFCAVCKEFHSAFYVNFNYDCNRCNMITFRKRLQEALSIKKDFKRQNIGKKLK